MTSTAELTAEALVEQDDLHLQTQVNGTVRLVGSTLAATLTRTELLTLAEELDDLSGRLDADVERSVLADDLGQLLRETAESLWL